ncbi:MAG: alpha/beta hydrolase [Lachnospiraceae bacterium]|nr:alpha/beta hydrolase [Lachnospiraceae bacterium]
MYIQLNSQVLYYEHCGEGTKSIILLHGNGETHEIFDRLTEAILPDYDIYAIDSRGQGLSATPKEYHYGDMAADVCNFIHALSIEKPYILGFSDGGIVALMAAMTEHTISGVIACGANASPEGLTFSARHEIKKLYKKTGSPLAEMMLREPNLTYGDFQKITCPVLYLGGEKDMISLKEFKKMDASTPNSTLRIFKGKGHGDYVEHTDFLAPTVREFTQ